MEKKGPAAYLFPILQRFQPQDLFRREFFPILQESPFSSPAFHLLAPFPAAKAGEVLDPIQSFLATKGAASFSPTLLVSCSLFSKVSLPFLLPDRKQTKGICIKLSGLP